VNISQDTVVYFHYTLRNDSGEELETSRDAEPNAYLHGAGNIIPGLEQALAGKTGGANLQVSIAPEDAYGDVQLELIQVVPAEAFQGVETVEPGMSFQAHDAQGNPRRVVVKNVEGDQVTIDANHPLAGVQLNFDVQVVDVREATSEEIAHGHVH